MNTTPHDSGTPIPAPPVAPPHPGPAGVQPLLQATNLVKTYPGAHALRGVSIGVSRGQALAIMGPSGSGKTMLLHCLAGLITPDAGTVAFQPGGGPPVQVSTLDRRERARLRRESFGFVFQQGLLMPELTAVENIAVAGMLGGMKRQVAFAAAMDWLHSLGLEAHAGKRIGQLSGGQAQRVAVARSQITSPEITFADEPTGALDSHTSHEVMSILLASTAGAGRALVVVTHDPHVAARAHHRIHVRDGLIDDGKAQGTARVDGTAHVGGAAGVDGVGGAAGVEGAA
ncbi:ABC transporter ATP-binding protein [Sediminivirga luteola]|uniref:ABC transporter ATP-binding protein n=1 Tax=Sediminivirga luteola TaxID=1774748 RepID=A0A8J2U1G1_9MICO|nr:ABC transporter ATP-binding protein [Sediminivirga luteola]GGA28528.1 ABC transporter ATP-binding protein [Sediminivirga luteola]